MDKVTLKNQISQAETDLKGLSVLEVLQKQYTVRFRFLDANTGYHWFEVHKIGTTHRYTVKIKFVQIYNGYFAVRQFFSFCPCLRFQGEKNCHHFLLAVYFEAERRGFKDQFDLGKFANYSLAKVYQHQLEQELAA